MEVLYLLEKARCPGLNECMLAVTRLGEETAFLAIALLIFWCVDKKQGYFLMAVGFAGTIVNQFLKLLFRIPRPWVLDPEFTILEQAREAASGYSFPSGHTQMAVGTFGALAVTVRKRYHSVTCWVVAGLVAVSRMYLGVHTPYDVLASVAIALVLIYGLRKPIMDGGLREMKIVISGLLVLSLGLLLYVECWEFPADMDWHNLGSGIKNAYTMLGCLVGIAIVYPAERSYVNFETKAVWWAQILKVLLGFASVMIVKEGLRSPLEALFGTYPGRAVRYFLIVLTAGLLWPMTFKWFAKLGGRNELRNHQKL